MKAAGRVVAVLTLIVAALQLVHDAYGLGVAPVSFARDAYLGIFGTVGIDPPQVAADDIVAANEPLMRPWVK
ncbi:MAG: hypothetical protein H0T94_00800 [Acidimicrobiia bacterium]|nr:hypothetical protein [Acidimicrobiia bacterium]